LWSGWRRESLAPVLTRPEQESAATPYYHAAALIRRADISPLATSVVSPDAEASTAPAIAAPAFNPAFVWPAVKSHERVLGTLIHGWLDHLGRQGAAQWSRQKLQEQRKRIERQCIQAGLPAPEVPSAVHEVLETLCAMLKHERGQKLLSEVGARREWALLDDSGRVSVVDLALQDERGWLIVDYKTGRPMAAETPETFGQRMLARYAKQLQGYCDQVTGLDGREARAALYFPRDDLWFEYEPQVKGKPC